MGNKSGHRERKATVCEEGSWPGGPGSAKTCTGFMADSQMGIF